MDIGAYADEFPSVRPEFERLRTEIRGFRVEPGEIEAAFREVSGVKETVVGFPEIGGARRICLYYTCADGASVGEERLREHALGGGLAEYMRPDLYVRLAEMLLPPNAVGELWIADPQVARGYLNRPEKTAEGVKVEFAEDAPYDAALADPANARVFQPLLAYRSMAGDSSFESSNLSNAYTTQVLARLGHFWTAIGEGYVRRFVAALKNIGFFETT